MIQSIYIPSGEQGTILMKAFKKGMKFRYSFRFVVTAFVICLVSISLLILRLMIVGIYHGDLLDEYEKDIKNQCSLLSRKLNDEDYMLSNDNAELNAEMYEIATTNNGRVLVLDRELNVVTDTRGELKGKYESTDEILQCFRGINYVEYDKKDEVMRVAEAIKSKVSEENPGIIIVSASTSHIEKYRKELMYKGEIISVTITLVFCGVAALGAFFLTKPFTALSKELDHITLGYENKRLENKTYVETEEISNAVERMLSKLRMLDKSREEFVSNVSHELKTPLTSVKVLADSLLSQEVVEEELYREFLQDIAQEIERENVIINDLLSLVKMDRTTQDLNIQEVDVNELLEKVLKRLRPIAIQQNVELVLVCNRPVVTEMDEVKMTLVFNNLVENAIKYNKEGGFVHVTLDADHQFCHIEVKDSGLGIPQEATQKIFERFYRVDKSHSREIGGTGLGLAIVRSGVLLHRGVIDVESVVDEGTTFTVRIPLTFVR